jgi:hypothetical protein
MDRRVTNGETERRGLASLFANCQCEGLLNHPFAAPTPVKSQGLTLTEGACTVPTDDGGYIPAKYSEFVEVFIKAKEEALPPH